MFAWRFGVLSKDNLFQLEITTREAAELLSLSGQRVRDHIHDGHFKKMANGKLRLTATVQSYIQYLRADARRSSQSAAAARFQEAKAKILEIDLLTKQGRLMDIEEAIDMTIEVFGSLKSRVYAVPARATADPVQRRKIEKLLDEAFDCTVMNLGKGEVEVEVEMARRQATADTLGGEAGGDEVEIEVEAEVGAVGERS